ncbi:hypothetical protein [Listeria costaricensis]|uniref:hypothetical protein n=1 Tax=Listeria costaricensis TaxID=2026604 RepID=UPI000C078B48|nr:hypothetical protein [Listeria costaricensis]
MKKILLWTCEIIAAVYVFFQLIGSVYLFAMIGGFAFLLQGFVCAVIIPLSIIGTIKCTTGSTKKEPFIKLEKDEGEHV